MKREPSLFEAPLRLCYCTSNGGASCQPCRDRRAEKRAAEPTLPLIPLLPKPSAADMLAHLQRFMDHKEIQDKIVQRLYDTMGVSNNMLGGIAPELPTLHPEQVLTRHPSGDYVLTTPPTPTEDHIVDAMARGFKAADATWDVAHKPTIRDHFVATKLRKIDRIAAIATSLGIPAVEYATYIIRVFSDKVKTLQSGDYPGLRFITLSGTQLYLDTDEKLLLPAFDPDQCAGNCGKPIVGGHGAHDPCTYCISGLFHKDTHPDA